MLFTVMDFYEGSEVIVYNVPLDMARLLAEQRIEDTDGECAVEIYAQARKFGCANECFDEDAFDMSIAVSL